MSDQQIAKIIEQLAQHEVRLKQLEGGRVESFGQSPTGKQRTLREIVRGKEFKNGQQQIAVIVGYHEKVLGRLIPKDMIKEEWINGKMKGVFSTMFFSRAKDTLIRVLPDGTCDLTQSGEEFFEKLLSDNSE